MMLIENLACKLVKESLYLGTRSSPRYIEPGVLKYWTDVQFFCSRVSKIVFLPQFHVYGVTIRHLIASLKNLNNVKKIRISDNITQNSFLEIIEILKLSDVGNQLNTLITVHLSRI
eukprot:snap_masked-scaffold_8-processed-gene-5.53-mRNA-1 protein AED:1.00 eAED:1.00 QI:0/0/0/0/1/1/2/0/115